MWGCASPVGGVPTEVELEQTPPWVILGLGSNTDAERVLLWALTRLCQHWAPLRIAQPCQSADTTGGGADYVNWVVAFPCDWELARLRAYAQALEGAWGARTGGRVPLDIDLLYHSASDCWHRQAGCAYWRSGILQLFPQWGARLEPQDTLPIRPWLPGSQPADRGSHCL